VVESTGRTLVAMNVATRMFVDESERTMGDCRKVEPMGLLVFCSQL